MKVCIVNPNYYRSSGVTNAIRMIYRGVSQRGIDQYFVDCGYGDQQEDSDWIPQDRLMRFQLMEANPGRLLRQIALFTEWTKQLGIPVVHVHHRRLASILAAVQHRGNFVVVYTGQLTYRWSPLFWLTCPTHVTGISESVSDNLKRTTKRTRVEVIRNPVEFPASCPSVSTGDVKKSAICIARLEPVKGHQHLISAWKLLKERGLAYKLLLVGEGSLEADLKLQVSSLGLSELVEFKGYHRNVKALIDECLFAILVSRIEGLGIVTVEAASCGRASLLTDVDGSRDCLPPSRTLPNGLAYGDVPALADALEYWFTNPERVAAEGATFFDYHKELSGIDVVASQYANLYESIADCISPKAPKAPEWSKHRSASP